MVTTTVEFVLIDDRGDSTSYTVAVSVLPRVGETILWKNDLLSVGQKYEVRDIQHVVVEWEKSLHGYRTKTTRVYCGIDHR